MKCQICYQNSKQNFCQICDLAAHLIMLAIYIPEQTMGKWSKCFKAEFQQDTGLILNRFFHIKLKSSLVLSLQNVLPL